MSKGDGVMSVLKKDRILESVVQWMEESGEGRISFTSLYWRTQKSHDASYGYFGQVLQKHTPSGFWVFGGGGGGEDCFLMRSLSPEEYVEKIRVGGGDEDSFLWWIIAFSRTVHPGLMGYWEVSSFVHLMGEDPKRGFHELDGRLGKYIILARSLERAGLKGCLSYLFKVLPEEFREGGLRHELAQCRRALRQLEAKRDRLLGSLEILGEARKQYLSELGAGEGFLSYYQDRIGGEILAEDRERLQKILQLYELETVLGLVQGGVAS